MSIARIGLIGAGNMGTAMIRGWLRADPSMAARISAFDAYPEAAQRLSEATGISSAGGPHELIQQSDLVLVAVKPHDVEAALEHTGELLDGKVLVSVAAGRTTAYIESLFPSNKVAVVRLMPNLATALGAGTIAFAPGSYVDRAAEREVHDLVSQLGTVVKLPEKLFGAATAIGGSGPGFLALVADAFIDAGVTGGLPLDAARDLTVSMLGGTAGLLAGGGISPTDLRRRVMSPGGTTAAGLAELERGGVRAAIIDAVEAAIVRAEELG